MNDERPQILILTRDDWANTGWRFCRSLQAAGYRAAIFKGRVHPHGYPEQAPLYQGKGTRATNLKALADAAEALHFTASTYVDTGTRLKGRRIVVQHGGSAYRNNPARHNTFWNPIAAATVLHMPDLCGLGAKGEVYVSFPVDVDALAFDPRPRMPGTILVGHWPSNPESKGTDAICRVIDRLSSESPAFARRVRYIGARPRPAGDGPADDLIAPGRKRLCDAPRLTWAAHLERVRSCDVYIEALCPTLDGRQYGTWGNAAHEAAALGKVVVTHGYGLEMYRREYGWCGLWTADTEAALATRLIEAADLSEADLANAKAATRDWVTTRHSFVATGRRLRDKVYGPLGLWPAEERVP